MPASRIPPERKQLFTGLGREENSDRSSQTNEQSTPLSDLPLFSKQVKRSQRAHDQHGSPCKLGLVCCANYGLYL